MDPNLAKLTGASPDDSDQPPILPSQADPNLTETYLEQGQKQPPQFIQDIGNFASKVAMAFDPSQSIPYMLGSLPGPQKFAQNHPMISDALNSVAQLGLGDGLESGMNSLPLSTLLKLAQSDTARAMAPPDIHDVINARNDVYHATFADNLKGILNSGQINATPQGASQGFGGVSTSRTPTIPTKELSTRFVIDPDKVQLTPTADVGYGKIAKVYSNYKTVLDSLSGPELKKIYSEAGVDPAKVNYTTKDIADIYSTDAFREAYNTFVGGKPNKSFEFESRTKNQPVSINNAVKELLTSRDPIEAWQQSLGSNNPVPVRAIAQKLLPLYRLIKTKELSQSVVGQ